jgi:ribosomal protein S18 acetylase RimI-like enzyme
MTNDNKPSVIVRDATTDDIDFIVECNCLLGTETEDKTIDRDLLTSGVHLGFSRPELCRYFIAEVAGRAAGMTMVTYELTDWRDGVIWWLQSVYVLPDFRNLGVFRAVYHHIETLARRSSEVRTLRLYVRSDNERAMRTYRAMGMTHAGYEVFEDDLAE